RHDGQRHPAGSPHQMDGRPMTSPSVAAQELPPEAAAEDTGRSRLQSLEFVSLGPDQRIGRVVSMSGSQAVVLMEESAENKAVIPAGLMMGTIVKVPMPGTMLFGLVSALSVPIPAREPGASEMKIMELELIGESVEAEDGSTKPFRRGMSASPPL